MRILLLTAPTSESCRKLPRYRSIACDRKFKSKIVCRHRTLGRSGRVEPKHLINSANTDSVDMLSAGARRCNFIRLTCNYRSPGRKRRAPLPAPEHTPAYPQAVSGTSSRGDNRSRQARSLLPTTAGQKPDSEARNGSTDRSTARSGEAPASNIAYRSGGRTRLWPGRGLAQAMKDPGWVASGPARFRAVAHGQ